MTINSSYTSMAPLKGVLPILIAETDVGAVTAGGPMAGWVSGSPASMAVNTTRNCVFDLGPDWSLYPTIQISITPGWLTNVLTIRVHSADTTAITNDRRLMQIAGTGGVSSAFFTVTGVGVVGTFVRPMGRYLIAQWQTDAAGTTSASAKMNIAMYPFS